MFRFELHVDVLFGKVKVLGGCNIAKSYYITDAKNNTDLAPDGRPLQKNGWEIHLSFELAGWVKKAVEAVKDFFVKVGEVAKKVWNAIVDEIKRIGNAIRDFFVGPDAPFMKFVNGVKDFVSTLFTKNPVYF